MIIEMFLFFLPEGAGVAAGASWCCFFCVCVTSAWRLNQNKTKADNTLTRARVASVALRLSYRATLYELREKRITGKLAFYEFQSVQSALCQLLAKLTILTSFRFFESSRIFPFVYTYSRLHTVWCGVEALWYNTQIHIQVSAERNTTRTVG